MKILIAFFTASLLAASYSTVHAVTAQQNKMKTCNEEANSKSLKGDERKDFMKSCLSAKAPAKSGAGTSQQEKMKTCNKEAAEKSLKGDERKKFMKSCLSAG
jgi:hypothetical protein